MEVIERNKSLGSSPGHSGAAAAVDGLTILSWNILADCYATKDGQPQEGKLYSHVAIDDLVWPARCARILDDIILASADVVCLQEVEPAVFERDFKPALGAAGYNGVIQKNDHRVGVATFWRQDRFCCVWENHRSRSLVTVLEQSPTSSAADHCAGARASAIVNVHLQGHARETLARVKQLSSSLRHLSTHGPEHHGVVVTGDFNCSPQSACSAYLAFGSVMPGVTEYGREVTADVTRVQPHSYALERVPYRPEGTDFTFTTLGARSWCGLLDHIWYSPSSLRCVARRQLFSEVGVVP